MARTGRLLRERISSAGTKVVKPREEQGIGKLTFGNIRRAGDFVPRHGDPGSLPTTEFCERAIQARQWKLQAAEKDSGPSYSVRKSREGTG